MSELVLRQDSQGAATLMLNRPERFNALTKDVFEALESHLDAIARETRTIGLIILRGAGGNFSSGYDMREVLEFVRAHAKPHFHSEVIDKLADMPQPVISAVQGQCCTGALELALAADLIVCNESAQFSDVYARWGLTPIWGLSLRLPHRVGTANAREMMFTCRTYSGREAAEMGLANMCVPDGEFDAQIAALAAQILANSWFSHRANKRLLRETDGLPLDAGLAHEVYHGEGRGPDMQERIAGFSSKRVKQA